MLFSIGHGQRMLLPSDAQVESGGQTSGTQRVSAVAPGAKLGQIADLGVEAGLLETDAQSFGYFFPDAPEAQGTDETTVDALKLLADAMTEADGDPTSSNGDIAPIFTYFGQFIDHDITANTDRDAPADSPISVITASTIVPLERDDVVANVVNLRKGSLRLDSLYGEGPSDTAFTAKVRAALRDPSDQAKMRLGTLTPTAGGAALPLDQLADLPRLGEVLDDPDSGLSEADIDALPAGEFKDGFKKEGVVARARALIGDGRNDENLLVAQFHLAFLRFHNAVAEDLLTAFPDPDRRFEEAKRRTILIYQWLVVNVYLRKVCATRVVDQVAETGAPLYQNFKARVANQIAAELPLPLEFSVAAFRFGHSMVRAVYDHNDAFPEATFLQLFSFTGGDNLGDEAIGMGFDRLPKNWVIDWENFAHEIPRKPQHRARRIDTKLAPPLGNMFKEDRSETEFGRIMRHLAERNLRRSHRLNIPSGQACLAAINAFDAAAGCQVDTLVPLSRSELNAGIAGCALDNASMLDATPLWFYCLKEAELSQGDTLGPLGSRIVAETLIGLIVADPLSYWHMTGQNGRWSPVDSRVNGTAILDLPALLRVSGLLA